jgi:hypothetical protein
MNTKFVLLLLAASAAFAQSPDPFTGTWKLNVAKSQGGYLAGTRTYRPVAGGTHVEYVMTGSDGKEVHGEYVTECASGKCSSKVASWIHHGGRTVEGFTYNNGTPDSRYVRKVSSDGKTMTIKFYPATGKKKQTSMQLWERQ